MSCVTGNGIEAEGGTEVCNALATNSSLTRLRLQGEDSGVYWCIGEVVHDEMVVKTVWCCRQ
jgi:hypothetical protein